MNCEHVLLTCLAGIAAVGAMLLASPPVEASPLTCEHRSAKHLDEHGGRAADDAWHVSHGQLPSCDGANGSSEGIEPKGSEDNNTDTDEKSRYCRKHFFC